MAERSALPTAEERRAYLLKLKSWREGLSPREQRMLDAVVLASFWPADDVHGYQRIQPPQTIYDESVFPTPIDSTPWGRMIGTMPI